MQFGTRIRWLRHDVCFFFLGWRESLSTNQNCMLRIEWNQLGEFCVEHTQGEHIEIMDYGSSMSRFFLWLLLLDWPIEPVRLFKNIIIPQAFSPAIVCAESNNNNRVNGKNIEIWKSIIRIPRPIWTSPHLGDGKMPCIDGTRIKKRDTNSPNGRRKREHPSEPNHQLLFVVACLIHDGFFFFIASSHPDWIESILTYDNTTTTHPPPGRIEEWQM